MIIRCKYYIPSDRSDGKAVHLNRFEEMCGTNGIEIIRKAKVTNMLYLYRIRVETQEQMDAVLRFAEEDNNIAPVAPTTAVLD